MTGKRLSTYLWGIAVTGCLTVVTMAATPPAVQIAAPEAGTEVQAGAVLPIIVVTASRSDIANVVVMADSIGIGVSQTPPYTFDWNTAGVEPGKHLLRAVAYLSSGEKIESSPVAVFIRAHGAQTASRTAAGPSPSAFGAMTLEEGTPVLLQTTEKMVSGRVAEGATVKYRVARDVLGANGAVLIPYDGHAVGKVTRSRRRGMFGKAGQLEFTVESVSAADGTLVPLRAQEMTAGKSNKNEVIVATLLLSVFAVFVHGRDVEIPEGTEITAYVDHDTIVEKAGVLLGKGEARGEPIEAASITSPTDGTVAQAGGEVAVTLAVTPETKFRSASLLVNGQQMTKIEGEISPLVWVTKGFPSGSYTLQVEVTFTNQRRVRTNQIRVRLD